MYLFASCLLSGLPQEEPLELALQQTDEQFVAQPDTRFETLVYGGAFMQNELEVEPTLWHAYMQSGLLLDLGASVQLKETAEAKIEAAMHHEQAGLNLRFGRALNGMEYTLCATDAAWLLQTLEAQFPLIAACCVETIDVSSVAATLEAAGHALPAPAVLRAGAQLDRDLAVMQQAYGLLC